MSALDLAQLAANLEYASNQGAIAAGHAGVAAGVAELENAWRGVLSGQGVATISQGTLSATVGATQRMGVYQEMAPPVLSSSDPTGAMAKAAANVGAAELLR